MQVVFSWRNGAGETPAPIGAGSTLPDGSSAQAANQTAAHPPHSANAQRRTNVTPQFCELVSINCRRWFEILYLPIQ